MYNPGTPNLSLTSLQERLKAGENALEKVIHTTIACNEAINDRRRAFQPLTSLARRVADTLASSGASVLTMNDAKTVLRKFYGKRAKAVAAPANEKTTDNTPHLTTVVTPVKTISVSQRSFTNRVAHFTQLLTLVSAQTVYKPNELSLTLEGLKATLAELEAKNSAVMEAAMAVALARSERDRVLYAKDTGLLSTAKAVKMYIRSVFGSASLEWRQSNTIRFRKIGMR